MAELCQDASEVNARILYWGIEGAGKTANLHAVRAKLRPDHRGELRSVPTRFDPTVQYEVLPIELGEIAGLRTRIQLIAVPGAPDQAPTRKQLLDRVDGIVLVIDSRRECLEANVANVEELRRSLGDYGRSLEDVPLVVQYNKRDLTDPYEIEELHRKLDLRGAAVFEAVATEGSGLLQTLSTISKRVIRSLRESGRVGAEAGAEPASAGPAPAAPVAAAPRSREAEPTRVDLSALDDAPEAPDDAAARDLPTPEERMERAILEEDAHPEAGEIAATAEHTEALLDTPWHEIAGEIERPAGPRVGRDLTIVSVGEASRVDDRSIRVPVVLGDGAGQTATVALTIRLDPLLDENRS